MIEPSGKGAYKVFVTCTNGAERKGQEDFDPRFDSQLQFELKEMGEAKGKKIYDIKNLNLEDAG